MRSHKLLEFLLELKLFIYSLRLYRFLFIGVLVISFFQSFVLTIGNLDIDTALIKDIYIPLEAYKLDFLPILFMMLFRIVLLFSVQSSFVFYYYTFDNVKHKRIISAILWFSPTLISPPFSLGYLWSPLASIGVIDSFFNGTLTMEDIDEGWIFILAAFGFYYLFWLCILIKNLLCNHD